MWQTLTNNIRRAFSESADQYDILTSLHKEIGRELVKKHVKHQATTVLDVGCGTGYVANKAKFFYPDSRIIGLDIAEGMLTKAQETHEGIAIDWLQADAQQLPFKAGSIDIIFSNLAYQWAQDLPAAFKDARRVLSPKGLMAITMFGQRTCEELFFSLEKTGINHIRRLASVEQCREALQAAGFDSATVDYELIKIQFKDMWELLNWLKAIGANQLPKEGTIGKNQLMQAGEYYQNHFQYHHGICATFEVIWIKA